jgi:hypothetical protein
VKGKWGSDEGGGVYERMVGGVWLRNFNRGGKEKRERKGGGKVN